MSGKYTKEMHEEYRRQQDEKAAKEEQERREHVSKENARQAWIRDGGKPEDFEANWEQLKDDWRRQRIMNAEREAREGQRASGVSQI
jgi:hypothetical protein